MKAKSSTEKLREYVDLFLNSPTSNVHDLKILPNYFNAQLSGAKRFEVRCADRDYNVGDFLVLNEWDGEKYTGRKLEVTITYILGGYDFDGLVPGFVILGTSDAVEVKQ
ncbi:DUF3850 domain-containing protein [Vibrio algicola]|uniref:DUF3850 domain-containing protein n=1 Tax=Vibrio algicola TaxID=2662262 RepID=A0A5Q0THL3_9VIBR|nr:DUF3850 domain-containing protein [Vibrio algicola]